MRSTSPIALTLALLAGQAQADPFRLVITDMEPPLVPNSIVDIAQAGGYFAREGVEVELVRLQQTPMALAALMSGSGEMANVATENLLALIATGNDRLRVVASPDKTLPYLIAGREGMTLGDLAGEGFGIGRIGSLDHGLSLKVLQARGVPVDDLSLVALGQPSIRAQALAAGQIGATTMSIGTYLSLPGHERLPVLVSAPEYRVAAPVVTKVNVVTTQTLASRGPEIEAVIRALTLAARDMAASPGAWADAMKPLRPDVPRATLDTLGAAFMDSWATNGGIQANELSATADWLWQTDAFQDLARPALQDWVDFTPVDHVLDAIGIVDGPDIHSR